jgi:hypothetical protein
VSHGAVRADGSFSSPPLYNRYLIEVHARAAPHATVSAREMQTYMAGGTDDTHEAGIRRTARRRSVLRAIGWLFMIVAAFTRGTERPQRLRAERRDARSAHTVACATRACRRASHSTSLSADGATGTALANTSHGAVHWQRPEGADAAIRVWIAYGDSIPMWKPVDRMVARDAFHEWTDAGVPLKFTFVPDSAQAAIRVVWRDELPDGRAGQVTRQVDRNGWLRGALVELNTRSMRGRRQDEATLRAVALHEVGHLIGLEHSDDASDIMAAWVRARDLTASDRAAAQSLYGLHALTRPDSGAAAAIGPK